MNMLILMQILKLISIPVKNRTYTTYDGFKDTKKTSIVEQIHFYVYMYYIHNIQHILYIYIYIFFLKPT